MVSSSLIILALVIGFIAVYFGVASSLDCRDEECKRNMRTLARFGYVATAILLVFACLTW